MTAKKSGLVAAIGVLTLACAAVPAPEPAPPLAAAARNVLVMPLNLAVRMAPEFEGIADPVWQELLTHLQQQDQSVRLLPAEDTFGLWSQVMEELESSHPGFDLPTAVGRLALRLSEDEEYDLMLVPSLVLRSAPLRGRQAAWDGVRRALPVRSPQTDLDVLSTLGLQDSGFRGRVTAASLHLLILARDGRAVFEGLGGLDVLQEATRLDTGLGTSWSLRWRAAPFGQPKHLREGIDRAFDRPVGTMAWAR
jgi:hypothetical protein